MRKTSHQKKKQSRIMNTTKTVPGLQSKVALQECIGDLDLLEFLLCMHLAPFTAGVPVRVPLHCALQEGLPQAAGINPRG